MKLLIIFPVANNQDKITGILEQIKLLHNDLVQLGAKSIAVKFGNSDVYFVANDTEMISVPKGRGRSEDENLFQIDGGEKEKKEIS